MAEDEPLTILSYAGPNKSTCGYCSPPGQRSRDKTSHTIGLWPSQLSCPAYQKMIDRGWRRSGEYLYKPDMRASCCPQYTIKLDALVFTPSKSMRKIVNRWNRYVLHGDADDQDSTDSSSKPGPAPASPQPRNPHDASPPPPFNLVTAIHGSEHAFLDGAPAKHKFEIALEASTYTQEKFELYKTYQKSVHNDDDNSQEGFERFLVESPLQEQLIPYAANVRPAHLPATYGSFHMTYRLDGTLIAFSVLDILPGCVSSVYFVYRPDVGLERFSMGKLSAMREAALAKEIHAAGVRSLKSLYLGFYVHSCPKMRYKGEYAPSYLLDPETHQWYPLEQWRPLLESWHYASIAKPEVNVTARTEGGREPYVSEQTLESVRVVSAVRGNSIIVRSLPKSKLWSPAASQAGMRATVAGLGPELAASVIFQ